MINLPIYRAKILESDEYICGYVYQTACGHFKIKPVPHELSEYYINHNTLSIHFSDMIDVDGTKIFASLSEDGKGGDIAKVHIFTQELGENLGVTEGEREFKATFVFNELGYGLKTDTEIEMLSAYGGIHEESFKVVGIQDA